jgi:3-hydroxyisobutyrate dehydrogenase
MRVGFIGIGVMGWPMASNILKGGHELVVYDADPDKAPRFAREVGGKATTNLAEVAGCEVVVTMLPTSRHVRQALLEDQGGAFAAAIRPGLVVVDMSSSDPNDARTLGAELAGRGAALVDAPVSGARWRATDGTLAIMIGGDDQAAIARAEPVLRCMGDRLFRTGALGTGDAMKALNNYIAAAGLAAVSEAVLIARRFGLDGETMADILNVSTGKNFATEMLLKQHILNGEFAGGFTLALMAKDVKIAADLGESVGLDAPMSRLVRDRFAAARDEVGADKDNSAAILAWDKDRG